MEADSLRRQEPFLEASAQLARLRHFSGPPAEFWPAYLAGAATVIGASRGALIHRDAKQPDQWRKLGDWTDNGHADRVTLTFTRSLVEIGSRCAEEGSWVKSLEAASAPGANHCAVAIRLELQTPDQTAVAVFLLLNVSEAQAREALARLRLVADIPLSYQQSYLAQQTRTDVEKFASALDLMVLVNAERRFLAAALALCNGLATRFTADRASLGWLERGYIRLRTISRTERFDRKMAAARALEVAMEEAFDQDEEVVWPPLEGASVLSRDHERFAREQGSGNICSFPVRLGDKPVGVITCERQAKAFAPAELQQLRLIADQAAQRLADLHDRDRWFGARWASACRERLAKWVGPEHTWPKVLGLVGVAALVLMLLPIWPYRVEGNFILRSDEVAFLTAPFEGYISRVFVRPGDVIPKDSDLLQLNTVDLELEEAAAAAELNRYLREAQKAEVAGTLAERRIAEALAEQVKARLDLIRYRLERSAIKSPFDGVVVEGDLRQRVGAPVKQGDALYKIARTEALYAEAEVNERDVHRILDKTQGEIAFVSQPKLKFPIKITRIEPAAVVKTEENVFIVRAGFATAPQPWWRPGMSGVAKFDVEKRSLLWILTHRTIDFLRMWLWW